MYVSGLPCITSHDLDKSLARLTFEGVSDIVDISRIAEIVIRYSMVASHRRACCPHESFMPTSRKPSCIETQLLLLLLLLIIIIIIIIIMIINIMIIHIMIIMQIKLMSTILVIMIISFQVPDGRRHHRRPRCHDSRAENRCPPHLPERVAELQRPPRAVLGRGPSSL